MLALQYFHVVTLSFLSLSCDRRSRPIPFEVGSVPRIHQATAAGIGCSSGGWRWWYGSIVTELGKGCGWQDAVTFRVAGCYAVLYLVEFDQTQISVVVET